MLILTDKLKFFCVTSFYAPINGLPQDGGWEGGQPQGNLTL